MNIVDIERRSCAGDPDLGEYFAPDTRRPVILTDAFEHWPAQRKWSWEYFKTHCYDDIGKLNLGFESDCYKLLTRLGAFIENLDTDMSAIPGFWLDKDDRHCDLPADPGRYGQGWSYCWNAFALHPQLRADIDPFPACVPNLLATVPGGLRETIESICGLETSTLYLSRIGAIAPFHVDFFHTFGSLFQFEGTKDVWFAAPGVGQGGALQNFDPGRPGFERDPDLSGAVIYHATLEPGQCVIIPPDWWHAVRAIDQSMTLSCNFFNEFNFPEFMACFLKAALEDKRGADHIETLDRLCQVGAARNYGDKA